MHIVYIYLKVKYIKFVTYQLYTQSNFKDVQ